jgi:isoleucyl-tRNA synthetase
MLSEAVYRGLTGRESVHLEDWPSSDDLPLRADDATLAATMDLAREVCSAAASIRKVNGLRNRLPLASLIVALPESAELEPFAALIADETNVKEVRFTDDVASVGELVLQLVPAVLGPRAGSQVQELLRAVKAGDWTRDGDGVRVAGRELADDEYTLRLVPRDGAASAPLPGNTGVVVLDLALTAALEAEGVARDVIRGINEERRREGLHVSDRIRLTVDPGHHDDVRFAVATHRVLIADETLATDFAIADADRPLAEGRRLPLADGRVVHLALHAVAS